MLQLVLAALLLLEAARLGACTPLRAAGAASQEDEVIEAIEEAKYRDSDPETLEELLSKDHAVLQGDIVQLSDRNAVGMAWPTHVIPYNIGPDLDYQRENILAALAMLSRQTCLSFPKRTTEADYLYFETSKGCASFVGFIGGRQSLFIGPTCITGNIVHETLHALGFHHEHTRMDRGDYIKVLTNNIIAGKEKNFERIYGTTFNIGYDVTSILHYGSTFFSSNGLPTIVANVDSADMGQRVRLTASDVQRVRILYNCGSSGNGMLGGASGHVAQDVKDLLLRDPGATSSSVTLQPLSAATRGQNGTEEEQTPAAPSSVTPQRLSAATRGQNGTSEGTESTEDLSNY